MPNEEIIKCCRYYKGEKENPFEGKGIELQNAAMFWFYEMWWSERINSPEDIDPFKQEIEDYKWHGLEGFSANDGVPISLKAILFNRYSHWIQGPVEDFKSFYLKQYYQNRFFDKVTPQELMQMFRYYKGEETCPFEPKTADSLWWSGEQLLYTQVSNHNDFFERLMDDLQECINKNYCSCKLVDISIPFEKRAIIYYLDLWHGKWFPYDDKDLIFTY